MKIAQTLTSILLFTSTVMTTFSPAFADDPTAGAPKVEIVGKVGIGGTGCPDESSASVTVSPDAQAISIIFSKFAADATKPAESRKSCNLAIPVKVPAGYQVSLYTADYRGYVAPDTTGTLNVEYFFFFFKGPIYKKMFKGEIDYLETQELLAESFSACGESVNMRVNAGMVAKGKGIATVDTLDVAKKDGSSIPPHLIYRLKYKTCPVT